MYDTYSQTGLDTRSYSPKHSASTTEAGAVALPSGLAGLLHPDNPMFWLGGILAVTAGFIGISGGIRVGRAKAEASIDQE